jgi:hypothetical protein
MRICFSLLVATVVLFGAAGESQAQIGTGPEQRLTDLKAAFKKSPELVPSQPGSEAYFDVAIKNICNGPVEYLVNDWLGQYITYASYRLVLIRATIVFTNDTRKALINTPILRRGSTSDSSLPCQELTVRGIRRDKTVKVILEMVVTDEYGHITRAIIKGAATAAAGAFFGGPVGAVVAGTVGTAATAYAAGNEDVSEKGLEARGTSFQPPTAVEIGGLVAGAKFEGNERVWINIERVPRPNLLNFGPAIDPFKGPGTDPGKIPDEINRLFSPYTTAAGAEDVWNDMLQTAGFSTRDLSQTSAFNEFCGVFWSKLMAALQQDKDAASLGLYAQLVLLRSRNPPDFVQTGCLKPDDWKRLTDGGYIPADLVPKSASAIPALAHRVAVKKSRRVSLLTTQAR